MFYPSLSGFLVCRLYQYFFFFRIFPSSVFFFTSPSAFHCIIFNVVVCRWLYTTVTVVVLLYPLVPRDIRGWPPVAKVELLSPGAAPSWWIFNVRAPFEQVFLIRVIIFALNARCYGFLKNARGLTSPTLVLQVDVWVTCPISCLMDAGSPAVIDSTTVSAEWFWDQSVPSPRWTASGADELHLSRATG